MTKYKQQRSTTDTSSSSTYSSSDSSRVSTSDPSSGAAGSSAVKDGKRLVRAEPPPKQRSGCCFGFRCRSSMKNIDNDQLTSHPNYDDFGNQWVGVHRGVISLFDKCIETLAKVAKKTEVNAKVFIGQFEILSRVVTNVFEQDDEIVFATVEQRGGRIRVVSKEGREFNLHLQRVYKCVRILNRHFAHNEDPSTLGVTQELRKHLPELRDRVKSHYNKHENMTINYLQSKLSKRGLRHTFRRYREELGPDYNLLIPRIVTSVSIPAAEKIVDELDDQTRDALNSLTHEEAATLAERSKSLNNVLVEQDVTIGTLTSNSDDYSDSSYSSGFTETFD